MIYGPLAVAKFQAKIPLTDMGMQASQQGYNLSLCESKTLGQPGGTHRQPAQRGDCGATNTGNLLTMLKLEIGHYLPRSPHL
jgi:hypothetical protein